MAASHALYQLSYGPGAERSLAGARGGVRNGDPRRVSPEPFEVVEVPFLLREHVHDEIHVVEQDPAAADFVMSVNGGNQTVPTVVFPDGAARTNPSIGEVKALLGRT